MPLYDFKCTQCGHQFEELMRMEQKDQATCPKCGGSVRLSYQGSCNFGGKSSSSGCGGNCSGCSGCGHH